MIDRTRISIASTLEPSPLAPRSREVRARREGVVAALLAIAAGVAFALVSCEARADEWVEPRPPARADAAVLSGLACLHDEMRADAAADLARERELARLSGAIPGPRAYYAARRLVANTEARDDLRAQVRDLGFEPVACDHPSIVVFVDCLADREEAAVCGAARDLILRARQLAPDCWECGGVP